MKIKTNYGELTSSKKNKRRLGVVNIRHYFINEIDGFYYKENDDFSRQLYLETMNVVFETMSVIFSGGVPHVGKKVKNILFDLQITRVDGDVNGEISELEFLIKFNSKKFGSGEARISGLLSPDVTIRTTHPLD